ncbi:DMT family transporter [Altererythrobacter sp. ZODW24]|uniref:DMT family transporter n=1 Tax=Altererythrobacter sp. ZODW24 TaxID=2185142 RepID=UPI000DF8199E|nr:DMT family transporter [Altererythrobacter sp. ZODW24]
MGNTTEPKLEAAQERIAETPRWLALAALLGGNAALALGPWFVRLADTGPVSAGFWRLAIALPFLFWLARREQGGSVAIARGFWLLTFGAGIFFALDLASWHIGIVQTRLGNATLFGNSGSILIMAWGLIMLRRRPGASELIAVLAALSGAAILLGRSLDIDPRYLVGDLFCIMAGFFYTFYILGLQRARITYGNWTLLSWSSLIGAPILLLIAVMLGEQVMPTVWWPVIVLALSSQLIGQGLLVWSLGHFPPLIIGMALLTQPAIAALVGWLRFGEALGPFDMLGMALVAGALVIARGKRAERRLTPKVT